MATDAQETNTRHTCNPAKPGKPLPFGRRGANCARCAELDAGATPRSAPAWVERKREQEYWDARRRQDQAEHFAPGGPHDRQECGPVCTKFEW